MNIRLSRDVLKRAADGLAPLASPRSTLPLLQYLHFVADADSVAIVATDLSTQVRIQVPVEEVTETGAALIPAAQLKQALLRGRGDSIRIRSEAVTDTRHRVTLEFENGSIELSAESPADFPNIFRDRTDPERAAVGAHHAFVFTNDLLQVLSETCAPFVSSDDLRPSMMGILLDYKGPDGEDAVRHAVIAATDGHRLVQLRKAIDFGDAPFRAILPAGVVKQAAAIFAGDVRVTIGAEEDWIWMEDDFHELQAPLITERYPNYAACIPTDCTKTLEVERDQLKRALEFTLICASQNTAVFALAMSEATGAVMQVENFDAGTFSREAVYHSAFEGDALTVGFNGQLFRTVLQAWTEKTVRVTFSTAIRASVWETKIGGFDALFLLMPVILKATVVVAPTEQVRMGKAARELAALENADKVPEAGGGDACLPREDEALSDGNEADSCPVAETGVSEVAE